MNPLTVDDVLHFAATLEGERLTTQARGAAFTLRVMPAGIEITPASTGQPRLLSRDMVQRVCEEYQRTQSTQPGDYQAISFNASYLLVVIARYMAQPFRGERFALPEEMAAGQFAEGAVKTVTINAYERDQEVRRRCIAAHGTSCCVCGFRFGAVYGSIAEGYIHVHHLRPLSKSGGSHAVDPVADLRPVCPNCHAALHRREPVFAIEELQTLMRQQRQA